MADQFRTASAGILRTCFLVAGMALPALAQQAEHRWEFDEPSSSVPRAVSLGNNGTLVFSAMDGTFSSRARLLSSFDVDPASSVWESTYGGEARNLRVDSSALSNRHALLQMVPSGSNFRAMVRTFETTSSTPLWQWQSTVSTFLNDTNGIHVSPDGGRVVAAMYNPMLGKTRVVSFDGATGAVLVDTEFTTLGGFRYSELSEDSRTLYLGYSNRSYIVDLASGGSSLSITTWVAALFGHALSSDGTRFVVGNLNMVRVFDRNSSGGYTAAFDLTLTGGLDAVCSKLAISADNRILTAGFVLTNNRDVRLVDWDLNSGAKLMDRTFVGTGTLTNDVSGLAISDDGSRIAVGTWGDQGGQIPHLMLFETGNALPYAEFTLTGSVMGLALSGDGDWVAVARKSTHANTAAGGGSLELFSAEASDVEVLGAPRLGGPPVRIQVQPQTVPNVFVLSNDALETPPKVFVSGTLFVARQGIKFTALQPQPDGSYATDWAFTTQKGNYVGQTMYFQGFSSAPRRLSLNYAAVTILP